MIRALRTARGWVRADIIVGVYREGREVKIRCAPGVFAWHPVVAELETEDDAEQLLDIIAEDLWEPTKPATRRDTP